MLPESTPYYVEEEELMLWSETSQRGPLISAGYDRYMELFKKLLPEKAKFLEKERHWHLADVSFFIFPNFIV